MASKTKFEMENNYRKRGRPRNPRSSDAPAPSPRKRGRPPTGNRKIVNKGPPYDAAGVVIRTDIVSEIGGSSAGPTHAEARPSSPSSSPPLMVSETPGHTAAPLHTNDSDSQEIACSEPPTNLPPLRLSTTKCTPTAVPDPASNPLITDRVCHVPGSISRKRGRPRLGNRAPDPYHIISAAGVNPTTTTITPDAAVATPVLPYSSPVEHNSTSTPRNAESYRRPGRPRKARAPETQNLDLLTLGNNTGETSGSNTAGASTPSTSGTSHISQTKGPTSKSVRRTISLKLKSIHQHISSSLATGKHRNLMSDHGTLRP